MMEVDQVLRPGGYWVLSGPPISWKINYKSWERTMEDLEEEQRNIEETATLLCWDKISKKGEMAIWQKKMNTESCRPVENTLGVEYCCNDPDDVW